MSYVIIYKIVYLLLLLLDLLVTYAFPSDTKIAPDRTMIYGIIIAAFSANLFTWLAWLRRVPHAIAMERSLSVGRMIVLITASTLLLGGLLVYSPLFLVFWKHVFGAAKLWLPVLWIVCALLLILEIVYFKKVGKPPCGATASTFSLSRARSMKASRS